MAPRPLHLRTRGLARVVGTLALVVAVFVLASLACGVLVPGIPYIGLGGRWHVLGLGAWWLVAALGAAFLLALVAIGARRAVVRHALAVMAALGLAAAIIFAGALGAAGTVAIAHGENPGRVVIASLAGVTKPSGEFATTTEVYTVDGATGDELLVDIYLPPSGTPAAPVVLYLHGGGWILHDRTLHGAWLRALADEGFVVLSVDYALATPERATWLSAAEQSACALVWAAENAERFAGDPSRIVLAGDSAGGGLALTTSYLAAAGTGAPSCPGSLLPAHTPLPVPVGVVGIVPVVDVAGFSDNPEWSMGRFARTMVSRYLGGSPAEFPDRAAAVDPTTHVSAKAPPTLLVTVEHDHLVPGEGARTLASEATVLGVPVTVVDVPFADHGLMARAEGLGALIVRAALVDFVARLEPAPPSAAAE